MLFFLPSRTHLRIAGLSLFVSITAPCRAAEPASPPEPDWTLIGQTDDISIYSRVHPGATLKEYKAVGSVNTTPRVMAAVLDDVENYTHFMPYITQCRILKREANSFLSYQRISPPFCTDRDYTIRVWHEAKTTPAGVVYLCRWEQANALGPAEQNSVLRVKINEGSWLVEPAANNTVRATYFIYTDSGGSLPGWLANKANQIAIDKLFEAIRKQARETKYASSG